jgi:hypothetical protein
LPDPHTIIPWPTLIGQGIAFSRRASRCPNVMLEIDNPASRPDWLALGGVAITIGLHLLLQSGGPNTVFIVAACVFWIGFVVVRAVRDRRMLRAWGFRADNLAQASIVPAILLFIAVAVFALYAHVQGTLTWPPHLPLLLLLYPVWGLVQQFLALAIVVSNLARIPALTRQPLATTLIGAIIFGLVHAHDTWMALATFLLEVIVIPLYLRHRNVWPLGVLHGWIGGLFYLWVMGRDPWAENFR